MMAPAMKPYGHQKKENHTGSQYHSAGKLHQQTVALTKKQSSSGDRKHYYRRRESSYSQHAPLLIASGLKGPCCLGECTAY